MKKLYNKVIRLCRTKATAKVLVKVCTPLCVLAASASGALVYTALTGGSHAVMVHGLVVGAAAVVLLLLAVAFANRGGKGE